MAFPVPAKPITETERRALELIKSNPRSHQIDAMNAAHSMRLLASGEALDVANDVITRCDP